MRHRGILFGLFLVAAALWWPVSVSAQEDGPAYEIGFVRTNFGSSEQLGQGIVANSGGRCVIFVPRHVVEQRDGGAVSIKVTLRNGDVADAQLERVAEGADIAMASLTLSGSACRAPPPVAGIEQALMEQAQGSLVRVNPTGGVSRMHVRIDGYDNANVTVTPAVQGQSFQQGMSGSLLIAGGIPIGMLLSVKDGEGTVLRLDKVRSLMSAAWDSRASPGAGASRGQVSRLRQSQANVRVIITQRVNPSGQAWDSAFGVGRTFVDPDPYVFARFADGTQSMLGYPEVTELTRPALTQIGMAWTDVCSNKFDCTRAGVQVFGDRFELTVIDHDPEISGLANYEVIGEGKNCQLDVWCEMGSARVLVSRAIAGQAPAPPPAPMTAAPAPAPPSAAPTAPTLPGGYQPRTALGRTILGGAGAPAPQAQGGGGGGGYTPQTELGRRILASRCTPGRQALRQGALEMLGISNATAGKLLMGGALSMVLDTCESFLASEAERTAAETGVTRTWASPSRTNVRGTSTVVGPVSAPAAGQNCKRVRSVAYVDGAETISENVLCRTASGGWERR